MTKTQRTIIETINRLTVGGVSPSYQEIIDALGLASKSYLYRALCEMRREGLVAFTHRARSIVVLADNPAYTQVTIHALPTPTLERLAIAARDELRRRREPR